jgi:hypothetical protein
MKNDDKQCCAAEALRRVKPVEVNGATIGLAMLDHAFAEVRDPGLTDESAVRAELLTRGKVDNDVPPPAAAAYATAVNREYARWNNEGGTR